MNKFKKTVPYNSLPFLPPVSSVETTAVFRKTISASRALANLNGAIINLPNPNLFIDTIHLQEAKSSSAIENIITTNDELYKTVVAEKNGLDPAAKEVVNYKTALWLALYRLRDKPFITTNLCIEIMQQIKGNTSGIRTVPGTTLSDAQGSVIYTPPTGEDVIREKLDNWEKFINGDDIMDPLIKMALLHYQFEAIHPFSDGNGRTGRILLLLYLKMTNLLDVPAIYLSEYIIENKTEYYKRLRGVTEKGDWESWILFMLDMVERTAESGLARLKRVIVLIDDMSHEIKEKLPKVYSRDLMDILFQLPYTKTKYFFEAGIGTRKTVGLYLMALEREGFLRSVKLGKEKLYLNFRLMDLLDEQ